MFDIRYASKFDLDEINRRAREFKERQGTLAAFDQMRQDQEADHADFLKRRLAAQPQNPETDFKVTFHKIEQPELPLS